ncbi:MAG: peptidoglycan D,D-transpeptidase FtsI family protein [Acidimicrobiia bacterium]
MNGPTRRLAMALYAGFGMLLASLTYIQVFNADAYRSDPRNQRAAISQIGKERGVIITTDGTVLARSEADPADPQVFVRRYPGGPTFAHVIGYASRLFGDEGLEAAYADVLRSRRDLTISDLLAAFLGRDLRPRSLQITLDPGLQEEAFGAMSGQAGSVVALDPRTGAILALVSSPSFQPEPLLGVDAGEARQELLEEPGNPLLDRATRESYPPGSTFKVLVAAAALESGVATPETTFPDTAEFQLPQSTAVIRNFDDGTCAGGGEVTMAVGFIRSCNTVFADLTVRVGAEPIGMVAEGMGFNREISFPWQVLESVFPAGGLTADPAALAQSGIGQRDVQVTPLQMAMAAGAVANDGLVMTPYLVRLVFDADGQTIEETEPQLLDRAMSPATARVVAQLMEQVVTEGTGTRAAVRGVRVAGKTGTAEQPDGQPHAWFIGFAPVDNPTIAVAVVVEGGGEAGETATGGGVAAPIAQRLLALWLERGP